MIHTGLVKKGDDAIGDMEFLRGYFATLHAKRINEQLCVDADTLAGNNFESIDRVTFSAAARASLSYTDGDEDIHGIDRSAASWADAVVSHNSGTDRFLSLDIVRDVLSTLEARGGRTNLLLTGSDTKWRIFGLCEASVRYAGVLQKDLMVKIGVNGVSTEDGTNFGVRVASVYNIPLFVSQAVTKDTISRIYALDTTIQESTGVPRLGISLLYPTLYFESGLNSKDGHPFSIDFYGDKGGYYTAGELVVTFPAVQGSIRDLK
jgi:hypothetical protein